MPYRSARPCSYPGCPELVSKGSRCALHAVVVADQRDPVRNRLYGRAWQKRSHNYLQMHPWCEDCLVEEEYIAATEAHHEQRHSGDAEVFRTSPLRALCKRHHGIRTAEEMHQPRGGGNVSARGLSNVGVSNVRNTPRSKMEK